MGQGGREKGVSDGGQRDGECTDTVTPAMMTWGGWGMRAGGGQSQERKDFSSWHGDSMVG